VNVADLRAAVSLNGGTPVYFDRINLLRQLVTAYGGTPTQWSVVGLLREAIVACGGAPTQWSIIPLERELLAALGAPTTNFDGRIIAHLIATTAKSGAAAPQLPVQQGFAVLADSRGDQGYANSLGGTGLTQATTNFGIQSHLPSATGGKLYEVQYGNFGVASSTSSEMIFIPRKAAGGGAGSGTTFYRAPGNFVGNKGLDALVAIPDLGYVIVLATTNDQTVASISGATSISNIAYVADYIYAARPDILVIVLNETGRGILNDGSVAPGNFDISGAGNIADWWVRINGLSKLDANSGDALARPRVRVVNTAGMSIDPTYNSPPGTSIRNVPWFLREGLHPASAGIVSACEGRGGIKGIKDVVRDVNPTQYDALPSIFVTPALNVITAGAGTETLTAPFLNVNPSMMAGGNGAIAGTFAGHNGNANIPQGYDILGQGNGGANTSGLTLNMTKGLVHAPTGRNLFRLQISGTIGAGLIAKIQFRTGIAGSASLLFSSGRLQLNSKLRGFCSEIIMPGSENLVGIELLTTLIESTTARSLTATALTGTSSTISAKYPGDPDLGTGQLKTYCTELMVLNDPNMTASPGNVTAINSLTTFRNINMGNPASVTTQNVLVDLYFTDMGHAIVSK
jgi:hypothetical protein